MAVHGLAPAAAEIAQKKRRRAGRKSYFERSIKLMVGTYGPPAIGCHLGLRALVPSFFPADLWAFWLIFVRGAEATSRFAEGGDKSPQSKVVTRLKFVC